MKRISIFLLLLITSFYMLPSHAWWFISATSEETTPPASKKEHDEWLKKRFSEQHQQLIPIVAVADIFISCNQARKTDTIEYALSHLINEMDRNTLATKLGQCLGEDTMQSDTALNFGLLGCFQDQLSHLPNAEREQKMQLVEKSILALSHGERKKSFTQCVTEQSIQYLK